MELVQAEALAESLARDGVPASAPLWVPLGLPGIPQRVGIFLWSGVSLCFEMLVVGSEKSVNMGNHRKEKQRQN